MSDHTRFQTTFISRVVNNCVINCLFRVRYVVPIIKLSTSIQFILWSYLQLYLQFSECAIFPHDAPSTWKGFPSSFFTRHVSFLAFKTQIRKSLPHEVSPIHPFSEYNCFPLCPWSHVHISVTGCITYSRVIAQACLIPWVRSSYKAGIRLLLLFNLTVTVNIKKPHSFDTGFYIIHFHIYSHLTP